LVSAVHRVLAGERIVDPDLDAAALSEGANPLTCREMQVLEAARDQATVADIAAVVYLFPGTVRNHLSVVIRKLAARNRADAVRIAQARVGCRLASGRTFSPKGSPPTCRRVENRRAGFRRELHSDRGKVMSTRDGASLSGEERAALAHLEARASADDPALATRLRGQRGPRITLRLPKIPARLKSRWWGLPALVVGFALMLWSLSTAVLLGLAGLILAAAGMWLLVGMAEAWWARRKGRDSAPKPAES
jgi:DNA-binding CsgD family transcriptional regulator